MMRCNVFVVVSQLFKRAWDRCFPNSIAASALKAPGPISKTQTATEVMAFFAGIAIVFTLVSKLFVAPLLNIEEVVYGLTFADESITLQKIVYQLAINCLPFSIIIAICAEVAFKTGLLPFGNKFALSKLNSKKINIIAIYIVAFYLLLMLISFMFYKEILEYISICYVIIFSICLILIIKCGFFARTLMIFTCFMVGFWCYFSIHGYKDIDGDMPVIVTIQDASTPGKTISVYALRCTISKEGFAVIKESAKKQRIIPASRIVEITKNKDIVLSKNTTEGYMVEALKKRYLDSAPQLNSLGRE